MSGYEDIFQAVEFVRMESCPTQAVLPPVGLAADKITRDGYNVIEPLILGRGTKGSR